MRHLTVDDLAAVVETLPNVFESHDVIQALMTDRPHDYIRELAAFLDAADPILTAHAQISRALHHVPGIRAVQKVNSPNVRGPSTANQQWDKVPQPVAAVE